MERVYKDKSKCCGCGCCENICPTQAIEMKADEYGAVYPVIDHDRCIDCGLCQNNCDFQKSEIVSGAFPIKSYAAVSNDMKIKMNSASGGIFATIANTIAGKGGLVVGCILEFSNDGYKAKHVITDDTDVILRMQGSKYVQSEMEDIYLRTKQELEKEKTVLFSGTPCQVAGLKNFLKGKYYGNLFTLDIICHGVPGNTMFQDYIMLLEHENGGKVISCKFRDKSQGWDLRGNISYEMSDGTVKHQKLIPGLSSYYHYFLEGANYRESCYQCKYACKKRQGDLTIGDFWGIEKQHPDYIDATMCPEKGISCILVNSERGNDLLKLVERDLVLRTSSIDKISCENIQLLQPCLKPGIRKEIMALYKERGYEAIDKLFFKQLGIKKYILIIWNKLPDRIRKEIKVHFS